MNTYWDSQNRSPAYGHYPPPPPQRPDRDGHGMVMLLLTLVGTIATIVSVLLAMGVGPFDLSGDGKKKPQTLAQYVEAVNKVCSDRQSELTGKVDALDKSITAYNKSTADAELMDVQQSMRSASLTYSSLMTQINAVPRPKEGTDDAKLAEAWRTDYQAQVDTIEKASQQLDAGDPGFEDSMNKVTDGSPEADKLKAEADKIGIVCD